MFLRINEFKDNSMGVQFCVPTDHGFAVTHTIKNIKKFQLAPFNDAVSPTGKSLLVCTKTNGKQLAIPFELVLIDTDVFEKHSKMITGDTEQFVMARGGKNLSMFINKDLIDFFTENYSQIAEVIEIKDGKAICKTQETIELSDEEWDQIEELRNGSKKKEDEQ